MSDHIRMRSPLERWLERAQRTASAQPRLTINRGHTLTIDLHPLCKDGEVYVLLKGPNSAEYHMVANHVQLSTLGEWLLSLTAPVSDPQWETMQDAENE